MSKSKALHITNFRLIFYNYKTRMTFRGSNRAQDLLISDLPTLGKQAIYYLWKDGKPILCIKNTTLNKNQKNIDIELCSLSLS